MLLIGTCNGSDTRIVKKSSNKKELNTTPANSFDKKDADERNQSTTGQKPRVSATISDSKNEDADEKGSKKIAVDVAAAKQSSKKAPKSGGFNIEDALPAGYVKDGSVDYTSIIQDAISKYSQITFPGFPLLINDSGLKITSNKTLLFMPGSELRLKASSSNKYSILDISNASNVSIINPVLKGDREKHIGTDGEWGMGINISSSTNVNIDGPKVYNCWGDGIYINQPKGHKPSKNINITNALLVKNRRNGISVISVNGLNLVNTEVRGLKEDEGGTRPMAGIDFEPNFSFQELSNITLSKFRTSGMGQNGIQFRLRHLYGPEPGKKLSVTINKHEDIGSPLAAILIETKNEHEYPSISGYINISNSVWTNNERYVMYCLGLNDPGILVNVTNPKIVQQNRPLDKKAAELKIKKFMRSNAKYSLAL